MANLAVLASGNGSNFQAIAEAVSAGTHALCCLICDRPGAYALERAEQLNVPGYLVSYRGRSRTESEREILRILAGYEIDLVALAGYMRLLSPLLVDAYPGRIVNIHPSLLPKYPGVDAITKSYNSTDPELGITIHTVDHGMDSGPVIVQKSFHRDSNDTLQTIETRLHELEHLTYPGVIMTILDELENRGRIIGGMGRVTT